MNARSDSNAGTRRVVIVGAGFAGLAAARKLASAPAEVLVIDRHNYNLFQPLLYQVATAALSPAQYRCADPEPAESYEHPRAAR
jgi:NADH:ubiquinone reductase (H+-translocating)